MQYNTNYKYNVSIKMYKIHYIYIVVDFKSTLFYIIFINITALFILLYYDYDLHEIINRCLSKYSLKIRKPMKIYRFMISQNCRT